MQSCGRRAAIGGSPIGSHQNNADDAFDRAEGCRRGRQRLCLAASPRRGLDQHHRRGRYVVDRGRVADPASRFRGYPGGCFACLYRGDAGRRRRRASDGLAVRPVRHHGAGRDRHRDAGAWSCAREPGGDDVAIHAGARAADRRWYLGQFRTGYRRHLVMVCQAPRRCRGDLLERQLPRWHRLATGDPAAGPVGGMAAHLFRHRRLLPLLDAAAAPGVAASASARGWPAFGARGSRRAARSLVAATGCNCC